MTLSPRNSLLALGIATLLVVGGVMYLSSRDSTSPEQASKRRGWNAPAVVRVEPAKRGNLDVLINAIGTVTPLNTVIVRSRVDGVLNRIVFEEGAAVERGDLLAEIDPLPYEAQLEQAEGKLQQNRAKLENAHEDLTLYENLWQQDSIARQQLSGQRALANELMGTVRTNEAEVEDARLQLSWTRITAPLSGKLGLRRVDQGNLISSGDSDGLVSITQMQPIAVNFTVPEVEVSVLRRVHQASPPLRVEVLDRDKQQVLAVGQLTTLDNQIDTATGTLRVRARFDNEDLALFPNQFVNVRLRLKTLNAVLIIPSDAVQYGTTRTYVYVMEDGKSYVREVTLGAISDNRVEVVTGIDEGDLVILEGLDRLRDGKQVITPDSDAQRPPRNSSRNPSRNSSRSPSRDPS